MPIRRTLAVGKDVLIDVVAQCGQVRHVEVPVDLAEAAVLVPEVAPLAVRADLLAIELPAILRLVLVVDIGLLLLVRIQRVVLAELLRAVRVLALGAVPAEAGLGPVLAHVALVHRPFDEAFARELGARCRDLRGRTCAFAWSLVKGGHKAAVRAVLEAEEAVVLRQVGLDRGQRRVGGWHKSFALHTHDLLCCEGVHGGFDWRAEHLLGMQLLVLLLRFQIWTGHDRRIQRSSACWIIGHRRRHAVAMSAYHPSPQEGVLLLHEQIVESTTHLVTAAVHSRRGVDSTGHER